MPAFQTVLSSETHSALLLLATKYTKDHEAIAFDDDTGVGVVSITGHAQESLGDVVFVELPAEGTKVAKGGKFVINCGRVRIYFFCRTDQIGAVESVKAASDIVERSYSLAVNMAAKPRRSMPRYRG